MRKKAEVLNGQWYSEVENEAVVVVVYEGEETTSVGTNRTDYMAESGSNNASN